MTIAQAKLTSKHVWILLLLLM